jgi:DNA-binding XRE family transcriptional regulator
MNKDMRERLEAAGFKVGDAEDFLGLTGEERRLVELRLAASRAVRRRREALGATQQELARKLGSSQSYVAKIEAGAADVSLDLLFRALFAAGGGLADLAGADRPAKTRKAATGGGKKPKATAERATRGA